MLTATKKLLILLLKTSSSFIIVFMHLFNYLCVFGRGIGFKIEEIALDQKINKYQQIKLESS